MDDDDQQVYELVSIHDKKIYQLDVKETNAAPQNSRLFKLVSFCILTLGFLAVGFSRLVMGVHSLN